MNCPLCQNHFSLETPPLLFMLCGHTFCKDCIELSFRSFGGFHCKRCSKSSQGLQNFVYNKIIIEQISSIKHHMTNSLLLNRNQKIFNLKNPSHITFDNDLSRRNRLNSEFHSKKMVQNKYCVKNDKQSNFLSHYVTKKKMDRPTSPISRNYSPKSKSRSKTPVRNKFYSDKISPKLNNQRNNADNYSKLKSSLMKEMLSPTLRQTNRSKKMIINPNYRSNNNGVNRSRSVNKIRVRNQSKNVSKNKRSMYNGLYWNKDKEKDRNKDNDKHEDKHYKSFNINSLKDHSSFDFRSNQNENFITNEEFNIQLNLNGDGNENLMKVNLNTNKSNHIINSDFFSTQINPKKKCQIPDCYRVTNNDFCSLACTQIYKRIMGSSSYDQLNSFQSDNHLYNNNSQMMHQFGSVSQFPMNQSLNINSNHVQGFNRENNSKSMFNPFDLGKNKNAKNKFFDLSKSKFINYMLIFR